MAPIKAARITKLSTFVTSISPDPIVFATAVPKVKAAIKLKTARPDHPLQRGQHPGGNNCSDRISRIMESIYKIKCQGQSDDKYDEKQA
jgi:hypothetical protein